MRTVFKRRTVIMPVLKHEAVSEGIRFVLEHGGGNVPISEWEAAQHKGAALLLGCMRENHPDVVITGEALMLPEPVLMQWCEGQGRRIQHLLNLPPLYDGGIQIEGGGMFHMPDFTVSYHWQKPNGNRYISALENGCFLTVAGTTYLLTPHAWRLKNALRAMQSRLAERTQATERMLDWHEVQQLLDALPEEERQQILQFSSLRSVRLHYANAFKLEAVPTASGAYDIAPVLMRHKHSIDATEETAPEHEILLTPAMQEKYAAHYASANSISRCHSLEVGRYVILSDDVQRILTHVQKVRKRPAEERLAFLRNPRAALMQELEDVISEDIFTAVLSDRVTGLGTWQGKIVPYINLKGQQWLPDGKLPENAERGIQLDGKFLPVKDEEEAHIINRACEEALKNGKSTFIHNAEEYPASKDLPQAIIDTLPPPKPSHPQSKQNSELLQEPKSALPVVIIKDNFDDLLYEVHFKPRTRAPAHNHVPEQVRSTLKSHQKEGFDWLCRHYRTGSRGALLADDMGLGKTLQALVFLAWLKQGMQENHIDRAPLLIVAPTGLLNNWKKEIEIHLKEGLGDCVYAYGSTLSMYRTGQVLNTRRLKQADLILTTYETLNKYQASFYVVPCAAVVFDEMQKVKNPTSQVTNAVNGITADFWLGMTGTPIENRLCDLWCITDILQPGWMGNIKQFSQNYEKPLTQSPPCYENLKKLKQRITEDLSDKPAYMLRRMKTEVANLPKKHEHMWQEEMTPKQAEAYSHAIHKAQAEENKGRILQALHQMRAISLHPDYGDTIMEDDEAFIRASSRLKKCFEILEDIRRKREKALLFVEYDHWHGFLPDMIAKRFGIPRPLSINGSVNGQERQKRVEHFQSAPSGFNVMLISPKAGGVGLTLTAANHVIHLTRWWNPAVEDQATDRVYRIGQEKEVHVHYPMAVHPEIGKLSYDLILHELLKRKRDLSRESLIPLMDAEADIAHLIEETIWQGKYKNLDKEGIDCLTGQQFQQFIAKRLRSVAGQYELTVRPAAHSWDGGADIIIETHSGDMLAIIQCKHCGNPNSTTTGSEDIRRAFNNYGLKKGFGITVTNARASATDRAWQAENPERHIVLEGKEALNPERVLNKLAEQNLY